MESHAAVAYRHHFRKKGSVKIGGPWEHLTSCQDKHVFASMEQSCQSFQDWTQLPDGLGWAYMNLADRAKGFRYFIERADV